MKKCASLLIMFLMTFAVIGCGGPGGAEGDENDPAETTDEEQMQDETGDVE
jgi:hypothetical protein